MLGQGLHDVTLGRRLQEADQHRSSLQKGDLALPRGLHLQHGVGVVQHRPGAVRHGRPGLLVLGVGEKGRRPRSRLDADLEARRDEHLRGVWNQRHTALALLDLLRDGHLHVRGL